MNEPKISVIIPLYNAEKFIRKCLISVLASKFADYEVLVVDDCSTDNSVAEVKKIQPHFDGRLKIFSTEQNSGGAGIPRNVGIKNSRGKYVMFIDNDDFIMPTALTDFFTAAEEFAADVVYAEKFFTFDDAQVNRQGFNVRFLGELDEQVDKPTLEPDDLRERIQRDLSKKFFVIPWGKLYRREFLIENRIDFPQMRLAEDLTFCFKCLCLAKNYVRIPQITNVRRELDESTGRMIFNSSREGVHVWLNILATNINLLDEFMSGLEFFRVNPDCRNDVLNFYADVHFGIMKNLFRDVPKHEVQEIFFDELQNPELNANGKNLVASCLYAERVLTR